MRIKQITIEGDVNDVTIKLVTIEGDLEIECDGVKQELPGDCSNEDAYSMSSNIAKAMYDYPPTNSMIHEVHSIVVQMLGR